jgi:alpha-beta hydrolase superfamily lysophospholipase
MILPRRAAAANGPLAAGLRVTAAVLSGSIVTLLAAMTVVSGRLARRVVTPAPRVADTRIVGLDTAAQTITLDRTADTRLPGRYGLFTSGVETYIKLGSVLSESDTTVKRKLLTHIERGARLGAEAAFSGWYYDRPEQLQVPYSPELIGSPLGPCPAWLFPASQPSDLWVIQIHGRGTTRAEALRAVPVFRELGLTSLLVSYRNDGEAPRSRQGTYTLGATEWRDVDAAVAFARRRGARRIVVMGWSMGGAIALQLALTSAHREHIAAVVLDSPAIDWADVLRFQAGMLRLPRPIVGMTLGALGGEWTGPLRGSGDRIPFDRLDVVARASELRHPVLILHSDDDGFVPSDASRALSLARPDLVTLESFEVARHTKLWNYDQDRWTGAIARFLRERGLTAAGAGEDS